MLTLRRSGYVYYDEETPLTFISHAFPEDMVNAFRYPLPDLRKQRARVCASAIMEAPNLDIEEQAAGTGAMAAEKPTAP